MKLVELDDGSGFMLASFPLPQDHWIYQEKEYKEHIEGAIHEFVTPDNFQELCQKITIAVRRALQGATMSGKDMDFDPDAVVQNVIIELLGHHSLIPLSECKY